ncbi:RNA polymerase sigma factor [Tunicatimonas pelagia]|uniref:RNA polymerase sigma factor n=1 Tax=Tunicatimonas pelagia TaxID=931531 RepID=UPI0026669EC3|nr:sigma-70 family RNA polymerase sigma factor [Tunicatimonas pelagia]WKN43078.1 sigma-70 family RNA polymerase sigma factor [Tunicatimonas pelagia]
MPHRKIVDHLFRHQYGKMVAILSRIFGLTHLELIEDAIQDTFVKATLQWRNSMPDNPEAWLTQAAKNRVIDLLRRISVKHEHHQKVPHGTIALEISEFFLDHEVEDSQLRMILVAGHPVLSREEQIAFALKTISGFSMKEIAAALLLKEEAIKKRLARARKKMKDQQVKLAYPLPHEIEDRMAVVLQAIYLIFNEGFHSTKSGSLISKDMCGEALRLCKLLLTKERFRSGSLYALFALCCFHASRLETKIGTNNELVDLQYQDRARWYKPLIVLGNYAMQKSLEYTERSAYHHEAAIAAEHLKADCFKSTDWHRILELYQQLYELQPGDTILLSMASVHLQVGQLDRAKALLDQVEANHLSQRKYLLHGSYAEYYFRIGSIQPALSQIDQAIALSSNELEQAYLKKKRAQMVNA